MPWRAGSPTGAPRRSSVTAGCGWSTRPAGSSSSCDWPKTSPAPAAASLVVPNSPGATVRVDERAPAVFGGPRPPRRLGHLVIGTPVLAATRELLVQGMGLKVSDEIDGVIVFLRCSPDHHNIALVESPVPLLQHYSWECDDVNHVGHRATALLRPDPSRHTWGLGRHFAGSNFYWYLRDPAGSYLELYSDLDQILDDEAWERRGRTPFDFEHVANSWGPDLPPRVHRPARPRPAPSRVGRAMSATVPDRFDVVVVGAGPVGCALSLLLGSRGRSVLVVERHAEPYPLPRAVHFDDETARILQACGLGDELPALSEPATTYEWRNGQGVPLLRFETPAQGRQGWPSANMFNQPDLEARLFARVEAERWPFASLGSRRGRCRPGWRQRLGRDRADGRRRQPAASVPPTSWVAMVPTVRSATCSA